MKVEQLSLADYNKIKNIPVVNQDLSASGFTPVANTYYRHTGATTATFTQGVIYLYDTAYHKLGESGGGISDVQVNGASVVTDGVANIPPASISTAGVVTNEKQDFQGNKRLFGSITFLNGNSASESQQSYGREYDVILGCQRYGRLVFFTKGSYAAPGFSVSGRDGAQQFAIYPQTKKPPYFEYTDSSLNTGRIDFPEYSGTAMLAPSTWSSGTSGSITLTESGTYQIYMNDGKNNINFGVVYWDGSADTYTQAVFNSAHSGYFATIVGGVITAYDVNLTGDSTTPNTNTIYYRRIGI